MPESFEGPVKVTDADGRRETVLEAGLVALGRTRSARPRPPDLHPPQRPPDDPVAQDPDAPPAVPHVLLEVGDRGIAGAIAVRDADDRQTVTIDRGHATFGTRDGAAGNIDVWSGTNGPVILISGREARITFRDGQLDRTLLLDGRRGEIDLRVSQSTGPVIHLSSRDGQIRFQDEELRSTLTIDGRRGDIEMLGADCAEDFDLAEPAEPGAVVCADDDGRLRPCYMAYDRRVVGVVSGAGTWRPGLRLDRRRSAGLRAPLSLAGKVYCLADAEHDPIGVGDLLTTSSTHGHAMRADDTGRAFGAVLAKSLGTLREGRGLLPVLVALQ